MTHYVLVYKDNLNELVTSVVYVHKEVAEALVPNYQSLEITGREIWVQPIDVDTRTVDKLC